VPAWSFLLADQFGTPVAELSTGAGRSLTFMRNAYPEATVTISHDDDAASKFFDALRTGIPTLRAYRDGVLRFHGELAPFTEALEETATISLVFRGPFARLIGYGQSRGRFTAASRIFTATDAGQIAKGLIDDTFASGVATTGTIEATKLRDRTYQYANVGEAVTNLTRVLDGFDFEVAPIEYTSGKIGQFNVYASQGQDLSSTVRFQYGPGTLANVRSVTRQIEPPINYARVLGANGLPAVKQDAASIAKYGYWTVQETMSDVSEQTTHRRQGAGAPAAQPDQGRRVHPRSDLGAACRGMTTGSATPCRSSGGAARSWRTSPHGSTRSRSSSTMRATRLRPLSSPARTATRSRPASKLRRAHERPSHPGDVRQHHRGARCACRNA
jgi:hypothetical protein